MRDLEETLDEYGDVSTLLKSVPKEFDALILLLEPTSDLKTMRLMDIIWPASQSYFHTFFIFIEMNFYSLSFLCHACNEVHEHMQ